jgi:hypothetical protein
MHGLLFLPAVCTAPLCRQLSTLVELYVKLAAETPPPHKPEMAFPGALRRRARDCRDVSAVPRLHACTLAPGARVWRCIGSTQTLAPSCRYALLCVPSRPPHLRVKTPPCCLASRLTSPQIPVPSVPLPVDPSARYEDLPLLHDFDSRITFAGALCVPCRPPPPTGPRVMQG